MAKLSALTESEVSELAETIRRMASRCTAMEQAAAGAVRYLYEDLEGDEPDQKACALVRFYKTHRYGDLNEELQGVAQGLLGRAPDSPDMKCLTLLGSAGEKEEWNSRKTSSGHKAIPLPSEDFVARLPMFSRLVSQFGLDVQGVVRPDPALLAGLEQQACHAFHVPEAAGSPYIPAQDDFVAPAGIRSVVGCGGVFSSGDLFALILFSKTPVSRETSERFNSLAPALKEALRPFTDGRIFD